MEPEQNNESLSHMQPLHPNLHTVTPLSKYLAMMLFIILPFVGGWIGYQYAPTKIITVEVERVVEIEKTVERDRSLGDAVTDDLPRSGDTNEAEIGEMTTALPNCFADYKNFNQTSLGQEELADWNAYVSKSADLLTFSYPNQVSVEYNVSQEFYTIALDRDQNIQAEIRVYDKDENVIRANGYNYRTVIYDVETDSWLTTQTGGEDIMCIANASALTEHGHPLYYMAKGEMGYAAENYYLHADTCYGDKDKFVTISFHSDAHSEDSLQFRSIIERLVDSIDFSCKG